MHRLEWDPRQRCPSPNGVVLRRAPPSGRDRDAVHVRENSPFDILLIDNCLSRLLGSTFKSVR